MMAVWYPGDQKIIHPGEFWKWPCQQDKFLGTMASTLLKVLLCPLMAANVMEMLLSRNGLINLPIC